MIILSQDKRTIVNLENIKTIELDREMNFASINIFRETNQVETGVCGLYIGHYKTEERAKKVLKDIVSRYEAIELCKNTPPEILGYTLADYTPIYEMPEDKED